PFRPRRRLSRSEARQQGDPMTTNARTMTPRWHAEQTPDAPAIIMGSTGAVLTYRELDERSASLASAMRSRGLQPGDHIAILMENRPEFLEAARAAQRSGLYYTAINHHLRP